MTILWTLALLHLYKLQISHSLSLHNFSIFFLRTLKSDSVFQFDPAMIIKFEQTQILTIFLCSSVILLPPLVQAECTCEPEDEDRNKTLALKYKMAAFASILVAGAIGVCFPILGKSIKALRPEKNLFFMIKAFAAGVILSTGFIHVLPDAAESLTSPCLNENPWGKFPFSGLVAMASAICTLMVDAFATSHFSKSQSNKTQLVNNGGEEKTTGGIDDESVVPVHTHATHGHAHGPVSGSSELLRHRVVSQVPFFFFFLGSNFSYHEINLSLTFCF